LIFCTTEESSAIVVQTIEIRTISSEKLFVLLGELWHVRQDQPHGSRIIMNAIDPINGIGIPPKLLFEFNLSCCYVMA